MGLWDELAARTGMWQHILHVELTVLGHQNIQRALVHEQIECTRRMAKVSQVIDEKVNLHASRLGVGTSPLDSRGGKVHARHIEAALG